MIAATNPPIMVLNMVATFVQSLSVEMDALQKPWQAKPICSRQQTICIHTYSRAARLSVGI